jgi:orotate phosphoribosyltransferase-like protein
MWYKINELKQKGLNKSQISDELGISRKTVRKYQGMNCEEFQF